MKIIKRNPSGRIESLWETFTQIKRQLNGLNVHEKHKSLLLEYKGKDIKYVLLTNSFPDLSKFNAFCLLVLPEFWIPQPLFITGVQFVCEANKKKNQLTWWSMVGLCEWWKVPPSLSTKCWKFGWQIITLGRLIFGTSFHTWQWNRQKIFTLVYK